MSRFLQTSFLVHDRHTELVVQPFADRTLVLVTQKGKVGHLIQASIPSTTDLQAHTFSLNTDSQGVLLPPPPAIHLTPIFGSAPSAHLQTLYSLYASQIATLVWSAIGGKPHSIIVGIALEKPREQGSGGPEEEEQQTFYAVMGALQAMLVH